MKRLLIATMATLAIAGCSQNEDAENAISKSAISFSTAVGKATKATPMVTANFAEFKVYAYDTENVFAADTDLSSVFMNGVAVTKSASVWNAAGGPFYWPAAGKVQFFAYSPAVNVTGYAATTGYPSFSYTIQDAQEDLLTATAFDKSKNGNAVPLTFKHILTQINFSANLEAGFNYVITNIEIAGVNNAGTYKYATDNGTWTVTTPADAVSYTYAGKFDATPAGDGVANFSTGANALLLMPQTLPAGAKINVTYTATATTGNKVETFNGTKSVDIAGTAWELGKNIRYILTLPNDAEAVSFAPAVDEWVEATDTPQTPA